MELAFGISLIEVHACTVGTRYGAHSALASCTRHAVSMLGLSVPVRELARSHVLDAFNPPLAPFVKRVLDAARIFTGLEHEGRMGRTASRCACTLEPQVHAPSDRIAAIQRPTVGCVTAQTATGTVPVKSQDESKTS